MRLGTMNNPRRELRKEIEDGEKALAEKQAKLSQLERKGGSK